eukprot:TRINITY_DN5488_c0_g1_i1.p1 TRINITY_DN5488_c0_g1~~TRINITY_DN5488_c0_g1_i1.p1  ORF type:complete len:247 (+),score=42.46 TRINITY_DN5488_c0_g1_i1:48-743(+)
MGNACGTTSIMRSLIESNLDSRMRIFDTTEIIPGALYLSSRPINEGQSDFLLEELNVYSILNITLNEKYPFDTSPFKILHINEADQANTDLKPFFDQTYDFIEETINSRNACLVHCEAGMSRSVTIVIAYLMRKNGILLRQAYKMIKGRRPVIRPNYGFLSQLMELERELFPETDKAEQSRFMADYVIDSNKYLSGISSEELGRALIKFDYDVPTAIQVVMSGGYEQGREY